MHPDAIIGPIREEWQSAAAEVKKHRQALDDCKKQKRSEVEVEVIRLQVKELFQKELDLFSDYAWLRWGAKVGEVVEYQGEYYQIAGIQFWSRDVEIRPHLIVKKLESGIPVDCGRGSLWTWRSYDETSG